MTTEQRLMEMQDRIKDCREKSARLRGQLEQLMQQLKAEGCNSIDEAESVIKKEEKKIITLQTQLDKEMKKLEEDYQWD